MLELLFQGFIEWIYGLILECWEYFASVLFDLMSLDFAYLREHMPVIDTIRQIMLGVGWALLIGNLVFQATRGMAAGLGFDAEDPKLLFTRTFAFSFLLVASPQICELGLNMTSTVIELLQMPDAVDITFADEASFGGLTGSWLLVVICGIIVMFQTFKLIMEMAERYFILAVLTITSPLAFGMGGSRNTSDIFTGWCRMFGSMCLLMATNVMFVKMLLSVLSYYPSGLDVLPWMVLVVTIVKVAKKADSILARIGLNPAMTGDPLGRGFPGAMTMMVVRSMVSNAAHTLGRNGNQPRSGSGNSKPNAPTGPRSGGAGSASNVNAPSHANGYHHSTSAQQNSANPAFNQESISAQTVAAQTDTVQSAAEKMAGAFPQAAPAGTGKQPNSTRKTAVPPGTRRAPGHMAAPKNKAASTAAKASPGAPYHPAGTSQPVMGGAGTQNTQQEQTVHSQSESHPRSSASVQNHGGAVSFGAAGKTAGQNPLRSTSQLTGSAGKGQMQSAHTETTQQRSTFVQAPNMAGAQPAADHPASPASPRSGMAGNPSAPHSGVHRQHPAPSGVRQENSQILIPHPPAIPQELVRGRSNRAVRRIRQRPVQQERSARPSADAIPSLCSRQRAFRQAGIPRSHSRTMCPRSSPAARCSHPAEPAWMAALQIGSILHPQCRHLRQHHLPTAKLVRLRARPRGLMQRVRQNSALRSAQFPHKAAAQKSRYRRLAHKLLLFPPLLPNGRAGNRLPRCYGQHDCVGSGIAGIARAAKKPCSRILRQASGTAGTQGRYTAGAAEEGADALSSPRYRRNRAHGSWDQHGSSIGGAEARCGKGGKEAVRSADRQNTGIHSVASRSA